MRRGMLDMPTGVHRRGRGESGPVIAFLAEYDALPGLSQAAGEAAQHPLHAGGAGHGCGHNLLGAGAALAAAALRDALAALGVQAVVRCYGCPAEEDGGGKVFFARAGAFDDVDAVFAWHPGDANYVLGQGTLAVTGVLYRFAGRTAHAAAAPPHRAQRAGRVRADDRGLQLPARAHPHGRAPALRLPRHGRHRAERRARPRMPALLHPRTESARDDADQAARGRRGPRRGADDGHAADDHRGGRLFRLCAQPHAWASCWPRA